MVFPVMTARQKYPCRQTRSAPVQRLCLRSLSVQQSDNFTVRWCRFYCNLVV